MIKLLCIIPFIIVIIVILFYVFKLYTIETFETNQINPVIESAKQVSYVETLKKEIKQLEEKSNNLKTENKELQNKLNQLNGEISNKENEKIKLESKISDIKKEREINLTIAELVKQSIDKTAEKERELIKNEEELKKKQEDIKQLEKIKENEKLTEIINKLEEVKKTTKEAVKDTDFCSITKEIPKPIFKTYSETEKNLTLDWCKCNENNKKQECQDYQVCKNNYDKYKNETSLGGEDLVLYFNCLKLYPEFPKYLTENNSKKI
jgi:DNA repair exonuclease SbcCD ATPase subunit